MLHGCYYCGAAVTSREHVPPRAFFPKRSDQDPTAPILRHNLLTVPSCDAHNSEGSGDDQIAAYTLLVLRGTNDHALQQARTVAARALQRDSTLLDRVVHDVSSVGNEETARITLDALQRTLDRSAHGLFFDEFGAKWERLLKILGDGFLSEELTEAPYQRHLDRLAEFFVDTPWRGNNQQAFAFQWCPHSKPQDSNLRMKFYGGPPFYAVPGPERPRTG